jgi:hypothetical protein
MSTHHERSNEPSTLRTRPRGWAGACLLWTVLTWGSPSRFLQVDTTCAVVALISGAAAWIAAPTRGQLSLAQLEECSRRTARPSDSSARPDAEGAAQPLPRGRRRGDRAAPDGQPQVPVHPQHAAEPHHDRGCVHDHRRRPGHLQPVHLAEHHGEPSATEL